MLVINLYGGPATGKSTLASELFVACKKAGYKTELVGEYAKWLYYEDCLETLKDQQYLFAEQLHRLKVIQNYGTEIAICDSPLLLEIIYDVNPDPKLNEWILYNYKKFQNLDFVLTRNKEFFFTDGRPETTIDKATINDTNIINLLNEYNINYTTLNPLDNNIDVIINKIKNNGLD